MPLSLEERLRSFRAARQAPAPASPLARDLFGGTEVAAPEGTYYLIERAYAERFELPAPGLERLRRNLRLLYGIGPRTEEKLRARGIDSLEQLLETERWSERAGVILRAIAARDLAYLRRSGAGDRDLLSFFDPRDMVFIDIETTGLYGVLPLFLVGLLHVDGDGLRLVQFLARRYEEEAALLCAVAETLPRFKTIVSYNGRAFDLPYLKARLLAHRLSCPLDHLHVDLLPHARRRYRGILSDCRLCTVEAAALGGPGREDDVPGHLIPELYHRFVQTQDPALIRGIIEHNALDLLALARLIRLLE
ncbi:MAG: ribonuclease H-like domain-containing protein [Patescibacteria group bacterium]